ncbi:hypothetical protein Nepgr_005305 [Nepenthes gracilis]|uniref:Uncharacterized protein n=1 Tax=Nepenthes gracilis TaxID=150966 RepID=A0AAD3XGG9_NEPGR|nr:hypothetical protein Nepgr_005305 [Nepenthes gracilis]
MGSEMSLSTVEVENAAAFDAEAHSGRLALLRTVGSREPGCLVPVFFGNELEDGVLCAAPDRIMVTGLFPCGWLADRRQLHQIADRLWGRFSLKWPFSFDTCGHPHLPPETDLAAGGVPVCWLLLVLPVDETCELLILVLEYYGAKRCCRASISADAGLIYLWLCAAWGYMGSCVGSCSGWHYFFGVSFFWINGRILHYVDGIMVPVCWLLPGSAAAWCFIFSMLQSFWICGGPMLSILLALPWLLK